MTLNVPESQPQNDAYAQHIEDEKAARTSREALTNVGMLGSPEAVGKAFGLKAKVGADPLTALDPAMAKVYEQSAQRMGIPVEKLLGTKTASWAQQDPLNVDLLGGKYDQLLGVESRHTTAEAARVDAENARSGKAGAIGVLKGLAASVGIGAIRLGNVQYDMQDLVASALLPADEAETYRAVHAYLNPSVAGSKKVQKDLEGAQRATENVMPDDGPVNWNAIKPWTLHGLENIANIVASEVAPTAAQLAIGAALAPETGGASVGATVAANAGKFAKVGKFAKAVWTYAKSPVSILNAERVITGQAEQGVKELMDKGLTEQEAWAKVAPGALLSGVFSAAVGSPMEAKLMADLFTKAGSGAGVSFLRRAATRLKSAAAQGSKEGLQEVLEGLGEDLSAYITYSPDKTMREVSANAIMNFVGGASIGAISGGAIHGASAVHAAQNSEFIRALHDEKARAEFVKFAPEKYGEFVQHLTQGGELRNLLVDAEGFTKYYQSVGVDPRTFAEEKLGVSPEDFAVALQQKTDLVVNTGLYATHIAGTEAFGPIYQATRMYQGGPLASEMQETFAKEQALEDLQGALRDLPDVDPERDVLKVKIAAELQQASKVFSPTMVDDIADGVARQLTVQAGRVKMTPTQLFEKNRLKITNGFHATIDARQGGDYALTDQTTAGSVLGEQAPAGLSTAQAGGEPSGIPEAARGVQARGGEGRAAGAPGAASVRVGQAVAPPPMLWHGTTGRGFGSLRAEGLGTSPAMGPGLHVSAGPHVALEYAEGNEEGLWRVGVRQNFTPFDASLETTYDVAAAAELGVTVSRPISGSDLWFRMVADSGVDEVVKGLQAKGFGGVYYNHGGEDAWGVWQDEHIVGSRGTTAQQAEADYARQGSRRDELGELLKVSQTRLWQALPSRVPTAKGFVADPNNVILSGLQGMLESPTTFAKNIAAVSSYPGIKVPKNASPEKAAEIFINHVKDNLLWLHDQMPEATRKRAKLWYDGAQKVAQTWATAHSKTLSQVSGVFAVLSPQRDWFQNVSLGERVLTIMSEHQNTSWTKEMTAKLKAIPAMAKEKGLVAEAKGKTLAEVPSLEGKALWLRMYDEAHNSRQFQILNPEAQFVGAAKNASGADSKVAWGSLNQIAKAISIYENADAQNISEALGGAHKVRNFYDNIFDPSSPDFVTIDTHAVGAGLLLPVAGDYPVVAHNFGSSPIKTHPVYDPAQPVASSSSQTGASGTYGLYQEAYIRAAQERGILPREMQSITWEAARGLFKPEFKTADNYRAVAGLWAKYTKGKASIDETRKAIHDLAGGVAAPDWETTKLFQSAPSAGFDVAPRLTMESMPGGNVRSGIFPGIANATPAQLQSYHTEKMGIVFDALEAAGVPVNRASQGHGYWDSESNPVTAFTLELDSTDVAQITQAARVAADVMNDQDEIGWNVPNFTDDATLHNAIQMDLNRGLTAREMIVLGQALDASGLPVFTDASNPKSPRVISFDHDPGNATNFHEVLKGVIDSALPADVALSSYLSYRAESGLVKRGAFDAQDAQNTADATGAPDVQRRAVARGRSQVEALNARYFTEHGWGSPEAADRRSGDVPVFQARKGGPNPVALHGVHYGNTQGLTALDSGRYGSGSPGAEGRRLRQEPKDSPLWRRTYLYESPDGGLPSKEGVVQGGVPYEVKLSNLYDLESDPDGIRSQHPGDGNGIEHAIIKAGYDGYVSPAAGVPGRAIVLIGHESVPVRPFGGPLDPQSATAGVVRVAQPSDDGARGYLEFPPSRDGQPRQFNLALLENENRSTVFHELGHFYLELLGDMSENPDAEQGVGEDYAKILAWLGVTDRSQITEAMHEKFADAHLVYLREGRAPVQELVSPFRKFSKWLTKLGSQLLGVDVNMTDEVRGVFDRLYATEQEIAEASKDMTSRMFATPEQAGMSRAEFEVYSKAVEEEVEAARERLTAKLMRQLEAQQKADYRDQLESIRAEVADDVSARPEYVAVTAMAAGMMTDGETAVPRLSKAWVVSNYGKDALALLPKEGSRAIYSDASLVDGDAIATLLNLYDGSGDTMMQALIGAPSRRDIIRSESQARMDDLHPGLLQNPTELRETAETILHGEGRERVLTTELQALRRKQGQARPMVKQAIRALADEQREAAKDRKTLTEEQRRIAKEESLAQASARKEASVFPKLAEFRRTAKEHVASLPVWKVRPNDFLVAQRKSSKEAYSHATLGNYAQAAQAKEREILSHYLHIEAVKAQDRAESFRDWTRRNDSTTVRSKLGKAGGTFLAQFDKLRDRFGVERLPNKAIESRGDSSLAGWVAKQEQEQNDTTVAEWLLDESQPPVNYRELTVTQMGELYGAMMNIKHLAYKELGTIIDGKRVEYGDMLNELVAGMEANLPNAKPLLRTSDARRNSAKYKTGAMLQGLDSALIKMEQLINWMDGNDVDGPAHRYIWNRVVKAQNDDYKLTLEVNKVVLGAYDKMPKALRESLATDRIDIGLESGPLTRGEVLTMLLYNGQASRRAKLLEGHKADGLTESGMHAAFSKLKPEDFDLARSVWASFAKLQPLVLDLEQRLTGVRPEWEQAREFTVYGAGGEVLAELSGGYFPLVADRAMNGDLGKKQEGGTVQQVMASNGYSRATTSRGHTKDLTGKTYPLLLDFHTIVTSELSNQIKDLTHREAVLSINRIFGNTEFQLAVKKHLGQDYEDQLNPWLVNIVSDRNAGAAAGMGAWNKLMMKARANTVAAVLGFKFSTMVVQIADVARVLAPGDYRVAPKHLAGAYAELNPLNPKRGDTIQMIKDLSPEMAQRAHNLDRDLRERFDQLRGDHSAVANWNRAGFAGLAVMDSVVSWPTWLGAYQQAMTEHGDQDRATKEADRTVRLLLMTSAPKDLTAVLAKKDWGWKFVTMFMGDATSNYNALRNAGHNINGLKGVATFTAASLAVMLNAILGDLLKGQWPEDDENPAEWALRKAVLAPFGTAPVVRDAANVADNVIAGRPFTDWKFSPAITAFQKVIADPLIHTKRLKDGSEDLADYSLNMLESGGYLFGVSGTSQAKASAKYFRRYAEGEEQPDSVVELGYDALRGKRRSR